MTWVVAVAWQALALRLMQQHRLTNMCHGHGGINFEEIAGSKSSCCRLVPWWPWLQAYTWADALVL